MSLLTFLSAVGGPMSCRQVVLGLDVTGMPDQILWRVYVANFAFLVGVAAAVMCISPAYICRNKDTQDAVLLGDLGLRAAGVFLYG